MQRQVSGAGGPHTLPSLTRPLPCTLTFYSSVGTCEEGHTCLSRSQQWPNKFGDRPHSPLQCLLMFGGNHALRSRLREKLTESRRHLGDVSALLKVTGLLRLRLKASVSGQEGLPSLSLGLQLLRGFPGGASGKESISQYRRCKRHRFDSWVRTYIPWRRKQRPTPVSLPGESHGQRSLAGFSPQGLRESDTT